MASNVASASFSRSRRLLVGLRRLRAPPLFRVTATVPGFSQLHRARWAQVQSYQSALRIGEIADQLANWLRKLAHQGREREDLIAARQLRVFQEIDHLDAISSLQMRLTDSLEVSQSRE